MVLGLLTLVDELVAFLIKNQTFGDRYLLLPLLNFVVNLYIYHIILYNAFFISWISSFFRK